MAARSKGRPWKRVPPPDATGLEAEYLRQLAGDTIVAHMVDGSELHGRVERVGRHTLQLECIDGPSVMVRIAEIRTIREDA